MQGVFTITAAVSVDVEADSEEEAVNKIENMLQITGGAYELDVCFTEYTPK